MNRVRISLFRETGALVTNEMVDLDNIWEPDPDRRQVTGYRISIVVRNGNAEVYWPGFHPDNGPIIVTEGHDLDISVSTLGPGVY